MNDRWRTEARNAIDEVMAETELTVQDLARRLGDNRTAKYRKLELAYIEVARDASVAPSFALLLAHRAIDSGVREFTRLSKTAQAG